MPQTAKRRGIKGINQTVYLEFRKPFFIHLKKFFRYSSKFHNTQLRSFYHPFMTFIIARWALSVEKCPTGAFAGMTPGNSHAVLWKINL